MSEWITDRRPTEDDADVLGNVFNELGLYTHWTDISHGRAWMPIIPPEPYVKPRRFRVTIASGMIVVYDNTNGEEVAGCIPTREAAERIAAIYEEVMP